MQIATLLSPNRNILQIFSLLVVELNKKKTYFRITETSLSSFSILSFSRYPNS
jgi:hypothetical protein